MSKTKICPYCHEYKGKDKLSNAIANLLKNYTWGQKAKYVCKALGKKTNFAIAYYEGKMPFKLVHLVRYKNGRVGGQFIVIQYCPVCGRKLEGDKNAIRRFYSC